MSARALYQPLPEIPEELRRQNLEAVAVARFRVAADGSAQVELVRATSDTRLNQALLGALARWRFFPATEQGRPVASELEIRVPISVH
jgi:protein TonB